jgi:hypothetical protein
MDEPVEGGGMPSDTAAEVVIPAAGCHAGPPFMTTTPLYPHVTWPDEEHLDFTISVRQDKVTKFWYWEARGGDGTVLKGRSVRPDYAFTTARTAINKRRSPP